MNLGRQGPYEVDETDSGETVIRALGKEIVVGEDLSGFSDSELEARKETLDLVVKIMVGEQKNRTNMTMTWLLMLLVAAIVSVSWYPSLLDDVTFLGVFAAMSAGFLIWSMWNLRQLNADDDLAVLNEKIRVKEELARRNSD